MKSFILGGLSVLLLSAAITPAVLADSTYSTPPPASPNSVTYPIEPFNLVYMAYQGFFKQQGIPSNQALLNAYRAGQVSGKDIVTGAVQSNRLPSQSLANDDYIDAVDQELRDLNLNNGGGMGHVSP